MGNQMEVLARLQLLLQSDKRYRREAYIFVHEALGFAQRELKMGAATQIGEPQSGEPVREERHLTGQQLCEAIRIYALDQFGYMAKPVLKAWGIRTTSDFGEIVYRLIEIGYLNKSKTDRREDFDGVYDFDEVFRKAFEIRSVFTEE